MTKADLQQLAEDRIEEAKILLDAGKFGGAYYLAGYAVECGLKACIANLLKSEVFPEKTFSEKCYIHDLGKLMVLADLKDRHGFDMAADADLSRNWGTAAFWTEASRYESKPETEARELYEAITNSAHGVLPWIKRYW